MTSKRKTILFIGDQTDPWIDGIDYITKHAIQTPWLKSFMCDLGRTIKAELKYMEPAVTESLGNFQTLQDLAEKYRHAVDETGVANAILIHAVRASMLLQCIKREPHLLSTQHRPEWVGISGGILSLSALAVAHDFDSLYDACLWVGGLICRICRFCYIRSRATDDCPGTWGWAVLGISTDTLRVELDQFQNIVGIPEVKRAHVAISGDRWSTIIGPPSVMRQFFRECPAVNLLPKNELNIHSLQHSLPTSKADLDYLVGNSVICDSTVGEGCRIWGIEEPANQPGVSFGQFVRTVLLQALSRPLDIVKVVSDLKSSLGSSNDLDIKAMGPSSHLSYLASALKAPGRHVAIRPEMSEEPQAGASPYSGRIAVVGMAGRGPGCEDLDELWNIILGAQDLHEEIPKDRFDIDDYFGVGNDLSDKTRRCATTSRYGCFMNRPGNFDARFFQISSREALLMDPGHRQFLMSACDALEIAGYSDGRTRDVDSRRIGVFYGQSSDDWHNVAHNFKGCDAYTLQASQRAFGAGRLAFHMGWEGPTYSLDSACASALSCLHLACLSLLSNDIDMAVSGAANIIGYPHTWSALSKAGILSKTGNCKTFRDDADGYCRADFVGSVVLKRLEDAVAHNDNILAVIAGTGRNHSGNSTSITTSDAAAQESLFRNVLQKAGIFPNEVSYVEMHGTGTQIGDPVEMSAITNVFSGPLSVGSIKANIGHSEAAAGMSSLLKSILMLEKKIIPPQAGMPWRINPKLPRLQDFNVTIPSEPKDFELKGNGPRRILVNNFDAAGGNSCLLLEDYGGPRHVDERGVQPHCKWSSHVTVVTAKTPNALKSYKRKLLDWLKENPDSSIQNVAYTTSARRRHHPLRSAYVASTTQELVTQLESDIDYVRDMPKPRGTVPRPVVFIFTGQGSHYAGMGNQLYQTNGTFREKVDHCAQICADYGFPSFSEIITNSELDVSTKDPVQIQLAVFTLEIALAALWTSDAGLEASMVIGHSLGEYAALCIAGVLSLTDGLYLVGQRALLLSRLCEAGSHALLSVSAPTQAIQAWLDAQKDSHSSCSVACTNSPNAMVIAGTRDEIEKLQAEIAQDLGARTKLLPIPYAFHSCHMDPLMRQYKALAQRVTFSAPKIPVASTLLASVYDSSEVFDAGYLCRQTREECRFSDTVRAANAWLDDPIWLEIGPTQVCGPFVSATLSPPPGSGPIVSTLVASKDNWASMARCLAQLTENGVEIDWHRLYAPHYKTLRVLRLPTYSWELQDFWITHKESGKDGLVVPGSNDQGQLRPISTCAQSILEEKSTDEEIGVTLQAATAESAFNALFRGHRVRGVGVCPGSVFVDAAVAAARYLMESSGRLPSVGDVQHKALTIHDLTLNRPLFLDSESSSSSGYLITEATSKKRVDGVVSVLFRSSGHDIGGCTVVVCDGERLHDNWNRMSHFIWARMNEIIRKGDAGGHKMQSGVYYALFSNTVKYDSAFKCTRKAYISEDFQEGAAEIVLQQDPSGTYFLSPYIGESLVQLAGFMLNANPDRPRAADTTFIMKRVRSLEQPDPSSLVAGKKYLTFVHVSKREGDEADCDVYVFHSDTKQLVMQASGLQFHETANRALDYLLGKPTQKDDLLSSGPSLTTTQPQSQSQTPQRATPASAIETGKEPSDGRLAGTAKPSGVFDIIIRSISTQTATEITELKDDTAVADLGVDSIMAIEITSDVQKECDTEFPVSFLTDFPTIGDLRRAFARSHSEFDSSSSENLPELFNTYDRATSNSQTPSSRLSSISRDSSFRSKLGLVEDDTSKLSQPDRMKHEATVQNHGSVARENISPPTARVTLLHGNPQSARPPIYLIADGTGSIATYLHLPPLRSNVPVYGIDSPFLRSPHQVKSAGIQGIATIILEALVKARPEGPFYISGFSGGGMLAYEVSRQLADAGRQVNGLLMIDICCPRDEIESSLVKVAPKAEWDMYQKMATQDAFWSMAASSLPMQHLLAFFEAVMAYHPPPMTASQRPGKSAVIWAEKGLIGRCDGNLQLRQDLAELGFAIEPYTGFMQDSTLGAVAWGVPHKRGSEGALGPNGWDRYVGEDILCKSVDADHLEMLMPGRVHLLQAAVEEVLDYFGERN